MFSDILSQSHHLTLRALPLDIGHLGLQGEQGVEQDVGLLDLRGNVSIGVLSECSRVVHVGE